MQGKTNASATATVYAGIDVSKAWLDIYLHPVGEYFRVANDRTGHRALKRKLAMHAIHCIAMEATGKLHRRLHRSLHEAGLSVAVINPCRSRKFADSIGQLAKTDRIDARLLGLLAQQLQPQATLPLPKSLEELGELASAWHKAKAGKTALTNRLKAAEYAFLRAELKRPLRALKGHIERLEKEIMRLVRQDEAMARRFDILMSVPGIGKATAITLTACLDELGSCTGKQIAALAGVAPMNRDSGTMRGQRRIRGGRKHVRNMLYMAALGAGAKGANLAMKTVYDRLKDNGKKAKIALTAIMRKLVILANTLIGENRLWQPVAP